MGNVGSVALDCDPEVCDVCIRSPSDELCDEEFAVSLSLLPDLSAFSADAGGCFWSVSAADAAGLFPMESDGERWFILDAPFEG